MRIPLDFNALTHTYNILQNGGEESTSKIMADMYGMLLFILEKQSEIDNLRDTIKKQELRIKSLEAKIGDSDQISEKLCLTVKNLSTPPQGVSELEHARLVFTLSNIPGVDPERDILKAVRCGNKGDYLGIVKVEMKDDKSRASIMKYKNNLVNHPD